MNLVLDAHVVIGATASVTGLCFGFLVGWGSRGCAEKSLLAELVRLEERLRGRPERPLPRLEARATPTPAPSTDTAKTTVYNVGDLLKPPHRGG